MQTTRAEQPVFARLANATWSFSQRRWQLVVMAMLFFLHVAVFRGVADPWARGLLLAHLGLVLLWQPFVRAEQRVSAMQAAMLVIVAVAVMLALDWWLLAFWVVVLAGLVGGKVYQHHAKWQRRCYLLMLAYLLALLAVAILPEIAPRREITAETRALAEVALPALIVLIGFFPTERQAAEAPQIIDFFYSVFLMFVLVVVILGSFTFMTLRQSSYLEALTYTVFLMAGAVLLMALAWNPRAGAGLGVFFVRYLFSIGVPLERWLEVLAGLLKQEPAPERFLEQAIAALERLPSVAGVRWRAPSAEGERGERTPHVVEFAAEGLALEIYSRYRLSPALDWHLRLLAQVLAEFYVAKRHEAKLRETSYLQAVHETGARTTHDIKNLLQSLNVLCSAAAADDVDTGRLNALVRRQLPMVAQRLSETLERLQHPRPQAETRVSPSEWWQALTRQYHAEAVEFDAPALAPEEHLPRELFDSVADNLIRNALAKRREHPALRVRVSLHADGLRVRDDGPAVPLETAKSMLRAPVTSGSGFGIGLYQAARQAQASGYRLELEKNEAGDVCFALRRTA